MNCPVCNSSMTALLCDVCGYDASRNHAQHPTFAPIGRDLPVSALRERRNPKNVLRCIKCGAAAFSIRVPSGRRCCTSCGWTPDADPRLLCECGSPYFSVRLGDGALICPLCNREIPLTRFLERVRVTAPRISRPAPVPVQPPIQPVATPAPVPEKIKITAIAAGGSHTVALYSNGQVRAVGNNDEGQCRVEDWTDIVAIAAGWNHTVGLKRNGTVVAVGSHSGTRCAVDQWSGITAIAAGDRTTVGLKKGALIFAGDNLLTPSQKAEMIGLRDVRVGAMHIAALRGDDVALTTLPSKSRLSQVKDVAVGYEHMIFLKKNRTCVAAGGKFYGQHKVDNWTDIRAVAAGRNHSVGLRTDGTVVAAGDDRDGQCRVSGWNGIIAIAAGANHTVGLKSDGTLVATGDDSHRQCRVAELIP